MRIVRLTCCTLAVLLGLFASTSPAQAEKPRPNLAALQSALDSFGLYTAHVDGIMGPATRRAMRIFQRRNGLEIGGGVDPEMKQALGWRGRPSLGSREMRQGNRGWDVAGSQYLLARAGFGPGRVDAIFGSLTRQAARRAQLSADQEATGRIGRDLLRYLIDVSEPRSVQVARDGGGQFAWPVSGPVGDGFGAHRGGGRVHEGLDFPVPMGTPVSASSKGTVIFAGWNSGGYGNLVVVQHAGGYTTWYAHLSRIAVRNGQRLAKGRRVGRVGSTGYSTGPHLHFEIRRYDTPVNPIRYLLSDASAQSVQRYSAAVAGGNAEAGASVAHGAGRTASTECDARRNRFATRGHGRTQNWIARESICAR